MINSCAKMAFGFFPCPFQSFLVRNNYFFLFEEWLVYSGPVFVDPNTKPIFQACNKYDMFYYKVWTFCLFAFHMRVCSQAINDFRPFRLLVCWWNPSRFLPWRKDQKERGKVYFWWKIEWLFYKDYSRNSVRGSFLFLSRRIP